MLQPRKKYTQLIHETKECKEHSVGECFRHPQWTKRFSLIMLSLFCILLWTSCAKSTAFDKVYTIVEEGTLQPGATIPQPKEETILTVSGKVGTTNVDSAIAMDLPTIESVGLVEYHVQDPFVNHDVLYRGVLMRDLLKLWQVDNTAKTVRLVALNDYQIDIPIEDFSTYPVLFALQADGVYMEPDYQGPAMLVYPVDHYDLDPITIKRRWIWQIKRIELE